MSKHRIASFKKDFRSFFNLPLAGHPITCKITNITLSGELFSEKKILAIGQYDLILCYPKEAFENSATYDTQITTRTFCQEIAELGNLPGEMELQVYFSRPLQVHTREGKPVSSGLFDSVRNFISNATWVEVQVEGEITAEIMQVQETGPEPVVALPAGGKTDNRGQNEGASPGATEKRADRPPAEKVQTKAETQASPAHVHPEMLADLVLKIIRQREEEKNTGREAPRPKPGKAEPAKKNTKIELPPSFIFHTPEESGMQSLAQYMPPSNKKIKSTEFLAQIPSRPGLGKNILPNYPPPKPPGKGG